MKPKVAVLVAGGRHPITDRFRRAAAESTALGIALRAAPSSCVVVHASDGAPEVLRWYASAADVRAVHLRIQPAADPCIPLANFVRDQGMQIVLCGVRAESGFSSGMTPYRIAAALKWPVLPAISELSWDANGVTGLQSLPGGRQRELRCPMPAVVTTVARNVVLPFAWARYRHAAVEVHDAAGSTDIWSTRTPTKVQSRSPAWQNTLFEGSPTERLSQIFDVQPRRQEQVVSADARTAALSILGFLARKGAVEWPAHGSSDSSA
jgi:electron transfer flavoprotein alpha/beta subunit